MWERDCEQLGPDDPETIAAECRHAKTFNSLGEYVRAEQLLKVAWDHAKRVLGDDHVDTVRAMAFYAEALAGLYREKQAEPLARQAWEWERRALGEDHPYTVEQLYQYTMLLYALKRDSEVESVVNDAVAAVRRTGRADTPFAQILYMQSSFRRRKGDLAGSIAPLHEAIELHRTAAPNDPFLGRDLYWMGDTLMKTGHPDQAEPFIRENCAYDRTHPNADGSISTLSRTLLDQCLAAQHKAPEPASPASRPSVR